MKNSIKFNFFNLAFLKSEIALVKLLVKIVLNNSALHKHYTTKSNNQIDLNPLVWKLCLPKILLLAKKIFASNTIKVKLNSELN